MTQPKIKFRHSPGPPNARPFMRDTRGAAAAEFVLWLAILVVPVLSAADLGVYAMQRMQLDIAAQAGVQAAWHLCDSTKLPAASNCTGVSSAITTAVQTTSLGSNVTVSSGYPLEGYFCTSTGQALVPASTGMTWTLGQAPPTKPADCSAVVTGSKTAPGDYIQVKVSYTYSPVFPAVSVAGLLTTPITRTAWMRLG
jgi:Flp pilus assembly protein TadG